MLCSVQGRLFPNSGTLLLFSIACGVHHTVFVQLVGLNAVTQSCGFVLAWKVCAQRKQRLFLNPEIKIVMEKGC